MRKLLVLIIFISAAFGQALAFAYNEGTPPDLYSISFNDKGVYVIVGEKGTVMTSNNGIDYEKRRSNTEKNLNKIIWAMEKFVAVGDEGVILTSSDGIDWSFINSPGNTDLFGLEFNGKQFVAVGSSGNVLISEDGQEWTRIRMATMETLHEVKWVNDRYIAVGDRRLVLTSTDGITWSEVMSEISTTTFYDIVWNGSKYIVVGDHMNVLLSEDGNNWIDNGEISNQTGIDFSNCLYAIESGKGRLFAVGQVGNIISSKDGLNWYEEESNTRSYLRDIVFDGNRFISVGYKGAILVSDDGYVWEDLRNINTASSELKLQVGEEKQLKMMLEYPYDIELEITQDVLYEIKGEVFATVDENGVMKALGEGSGELVITYDKKLKKIPLYITPNENGPSIKPSQEDSNDTVKSGKEGNNFIVIGIVLITILVLTAVLVYFYRKIRKLHE